MGNFGNNVRNMLNIKITSGPILNGPISVEGFGLGDFR
jgi:hypothetical protein